MAHAWLDSLSDDWPSDQLDESVAQLPQLLDTPERPTPSKLRSQASKIPLRSGGTRPIYSPSNPNSSNVLIERSANDINIGRNRPSKLSQEIKPGQSTQRTASTATDGSVVHNTIQEHESPYKDGQTPEWKRRLVNGELGYGEQKDLFCSAATGLQDMFKPPEPKEEGGKEIHDGKFDMTMPSSPPLYEYGVEEEIDRLVDLAEAEESEQFPQQVTPSPSPRRAKRGVNYRSTSEALPNGLEHLSTNEYEETPIRSREADDTLDQYLTVPYDDGQTSRQTSGQSVIRNEEFSPINLGGVRGATAPFKFEEGITEELHNRLSQLQLHSPMTHGGQHQRAQSTDTNDNSINPAFRRSSKAADASFYSRALSPGLVVDTSEILPEESLQASTPKEYPSVRTHSPKASRSAAFDESPELPSAPFTSPSKSEGQERHRATSSGSPLKLFGPYDTFTNQTLLRRISQFEDFNSVSASDESVIATRVDHSTSLTGLEEELDDSRIEVKQSVSFFGDGDLDNFEFTAEREVDEKPTRPPQRGDGWLSGNGPKLVVGRHRTPSGSHRQPSAARMMAMRAASKSGMTSSTESLLEAKRPRTSPVKDPTPKRRRTLHRSDIAFEEQSAEDIPYNPGKKRKDALPGSWRLASAEIMAVRQILDVRNPTPPRVRAAPLTPRAKESPRRQSQAAKAFAEAKVDRKPSIRTQDFVDQAAQIMAMIRNQVKPSGMASLEESEEDNAQYEELSNVQPSHQESTFEPFSRPPSREGRSLSKPTDLEDNLELISKLKKYREFSDAGGLISSSLRSFKLNHQSAAPEGPLSMEGEVESDIPNVRIRVNYPGAEVDGDYQTHSSGHLSSNSVPTISSRGSDSRRVILPDTVSHLIPERVGSMYLDKSQNIWVKRKESDAYLEDEIPPSPQEDSEEDPFASIPDLSVDMTKELQNLKTASRAESSASSMPRIVSVARHELAKLEESTKTSRQGAVPLQEKSRRRNMISFSSPVASVIQEALPEYLDSLEDEGDSYDPNADHTPEQEPEDSRWVGNQSAQAPAVSRYGSMKGRDFVPRPVSPIDEQEEEDATVELPAHDNYQDDRQLSIIGDQSLMARHTPERRYGSMSLIFNGNNNAMARFGDESFLVGQNAGMLSLSPLSDFTFNQPDQSFGLEVSYVVGQRHVSTGDGSKRVLSMTIRDLVDRLSEVEPFEPYWDDIAELDLSDKRLGSLHMLDEFCGKVIRLDASQNSLGHLEGVPSSVRQLKVTENELTELTSWDHLMNLQYVDISGNEVRTLTSLRNLVHLRSLRADNNQLTTLDGIGKHDGLLSLRARDNYIQELDFADAPMDRLSELDLVGNSLTSIYNLDLLPSLTHLKLSQNKLQSFELPVVMESLRHLDVSDNDISYIDVSTMPNLHTLHADRNCITRIEGMEKAKRLDSLSLREQKGEEPLDMEILASVSEVRKLFLSGNYLERLPLEVDMLNLQLLELANCGLSKLPKNIGQLTPNLRTLNINFNAISNLSPLRYIPRLKNLFAAGNRLADSTAATKLLMEFPHLSKLDVRDNPMTLGYYAPSQALVLVKTDDKSARFSLPDADELLDALYASRLDEVTRLRRRLHQVVLSASCKRLRMLDGLKLRRKELLAMDSVLLQLIEDGLLPDPRADEQGDDVDGSVKREDGQDEPEASGEMPQSSVWRAEDSFA